MTIRRMAIMTTIMIMVMVMTALPITKHDGSHRVMHVLYVRVACVSKGF